MPPRSTSASASSSAPTPTPIRTSRAASAPSPSRCRSRNIVSRGPRRPNDVEVLEAMVDLDGLPPLLTGMRVDVFFKHDATASNRSHDAAQAALPSIDAGARR